MNCWREQGFLGFAVICRKLRLLPWTTREPTSPRSALTRWRTPLSSSKTDRSVASQNTREWDEVDWWRLVHADLSCRERRWGTRLLWCQTNLWLLLKSFRWASLFLQEASEVWCFWTFPSSADSAATLVEGDATALLPGTVCENSRERVAWLVWAAQMWSGTQGLLAKLSWPSHVSVNKE